MNLPGGQEGSLLTCLVKVASCVGTITQGLHSQVSWLGDRQV